MSLKDELYAVLSSHERGEKTGTPDYILAKFLMTSLKAFEAAVDAREEFHIAEIYKENEGAI